MYSILNTLSEYIYFDIPFYLFLKSSKAFSVSLRTLENNKGSKKPFDVLSFAFCC